MFELQVSDYDLWTFLGNNNFFRPNASIFTQQPLLTWVNSNSRAVLPSAGRYKRHLIEFIRKYHPGQWLESVQKENSNHVNYAKTSRPDWYVNHWLFVTDQEAVTLPSSPFWNKQLWLEKAKGYSNLFK